MSLEAICRAAAAKIPGAKAFPGGGLALKRRGFDGRAEFAPDAWDVIFDTHELPVEPLEVAPAGWWHDLRDLLGFKDVQLDDLEFDRAFHVQSSAPDFAARVLQPWLRKRLQDVLRFGRFRWWLTRAGFLLRVEGRPPDGAEVDRWVTLAIDLLEALPGTEGKERMTLGAARTKIDAESVCGVCGASLAEGRRLRCGKCRTPHHADCWAFNGRCSIFACGGTSAL